jgi:hypothetical protein
MIDENIGKYEGKQKREVTDDLKKRYVQGENCVLRYSLYSLYFGVRCFPLGTITLRKIISMNSNLFIVEFRIHVIDR